MLNNYTIKSIITIGYSSVSLIRLTSEYSGGGVLKINVAQEPPYLLVCSVILKYLSKGSPSRFITDLQNGQILSKAVFNIILE
ncbi:MAG: hypothetical protein KDE33_22985 [Bacteroidetes bacterium]|nr:hypothetical protein [Bacteroidota bacterium]